MDTIQFLNLRKSLKEGQSLVLEFDGTVKITEINRTGGKRKCKIMGKLVDFENEIVPVKSKLWATPPLPGKQKYYKFGDPLPKRDNNSYEIKTLIGVVLTFKDTAKRFKYTDTINKFDYDVIQVSDIKVYFSYGIPRFIEMGDKRTYINERLPELKLEVFPNIDEVK